MHSVLSAALFACILSLSSPRTAPAAEIPDTYERMSAANFTGGMASGQLFADFSAPATKRVYVVFKPVGDVSATYSENKALSIFSNRIQVGSTIFNCGSAVILNQPVSIDIDFKNKKLSCNGVEQTISFTTLTGMAESVSLGNGNNLGLVYKAKSWENGVLIHDYVAVKRRSDGLCGWWDYVEGDYTLRASGAIGCKTFAEEPWGI